MGFSGHEDVPSSREEGRPPTSPGVSVDVLLLLCSPGRRRMFYGEVQVHQPYGSIKTHQAMHSSEAEHD